MGALNCSQARPKEGRPKLGNESLLLCLTPEIHARIFWLLAGEYGDFVCLQPVTNLAKIQNALNCDWLALHDLHVVLSSTGLVRPWNMVLVMYSLLSSQSSLVMSQQALHWLWDIVTGFSKPWLCPKEPLEAKSLEPLRQWLQKFVSKEIHTWHDLTEERIYEASGSSAALRQRKERVVKLALWLILVHVAWLGNDWQEPLRRGTLELKGPGWDGLAVVKSVIQDDESTTGGGACSISFPAWTMDAAWVHSQRGLLRDGASRWAPRGAMDATRDTGTKGTADEGDGALNTRAQKRRKDQYVLLNVIRCVVLLVAMLNMQGQAWAGPRSALGRRSFFLATATLPLGQLMDARAEGPIDAWWL
eukprot:g2441.t1